MMGEGKKEQDVGGARQKSGKHLKAIVFFIALVLFIVAILAIAFLISQNSNQGETPGPASGEPPLSPGPATPILGTPGAAAILSKDTATDAAIEEAFKTNDEMLYVFCEELNAGDNVAAMGDGAKYNVSGPVWFAYVDEVPGAFFEHDVRYIFIDASTGQKKIYEESWPPDINGEDMFDAAEGCGGVTEVYAT